jgi:hypothetical protein
MMAASKATCVALVALAAICVPHSANSTERVCMSLVSPDVLLCTNHRDTPLVCDATAKPVKCQTFKALYASWRGHPERRAEFYLKLYGAAQ